MTETWQVDAAAAEVYERNFVPALFGTWAGPLCDAAGVTAGDRVLDLACGTGVVAREAARRGASPVGTDCNAGMLGVAKRIVPVMEWVRADAAALPFPDASFDRTLCQFALMYFPDRPAALREARRVTRPEGTIAFAVWASIDQSPGYAVLADVFERAAGAEAAATLRAPYVLADAIELRRLLAEAGVEAVTIDTRTEMAHFASVDDFVRTEVEGSPLAGTIGEAGYNALLEDARTSLAPFSAPDGVRFAVGAHIAVGIG